MGEDEPEKKKFVERLIDHVDALVLKLPEGEERENLVKHVGELRVRIAAYREHPGLSNIEEAKGFQVLCSACAQAMVRHGETMDDDTFRIVLDWGKDRVPHTVSSHAVHAFHFRLERYLKIIEVRNEPDYEEKKRAALELKGLVDQIKPDEHTDKEILLAVNKALTPVQKDMLRFNL